MRCVCGELMTCSGPGRYRCPVHYKTPRERVIQSLDKEIQWFEEHRDYFQTSNCADTAIHRLKARRDEVNRIMSE